jgi:CTP synthase (UTP-ammonia lyase)
MIRVVLVGDYNNEVLAHDAIPKALALAAKKLAIDFTHEWLPTHEITSTRSLTSIRPSAIWCVPGSPYRNMDGALTAIRYARESDLPFLGTCGGFQHALIEYARNVLRIADADHTESNSKAKTPLISKLTCALVNKSETIRVVPTTRLAAIYGSEQVTEPYQCSYGLNPDFRKQFESSATLRFAAFSGEQVRAFELADHRFFVGTLFQPERSALRGEVHPLIEAFVKAAV